jgi:hypothetical protein
MKRITCALLFLAACTKAEGQPESKPESTPLPAPPQAAAEPKPVAAEPKPVAAARPKPAADELADGFDGKPQLTWHGVDAGAYRTKDDEIVLRVGGKDMTKPIRADNAQLILHAVDDDLVLVTRTSYGQDGMGYEVFDVVWDLEPDVEGTWSCDDSDVPGGCTFPGWAFADGVTPPADPLEAGIDRAWRTDSTECKTTLTAQEQALHDGYLALCKTALARVAKCAKDPAFAREAKITGVPIADPSLVGPKHAEKTCTELAHDQMCGDAIGHQTYFTVGYDLVDLRSALSASDCASVASALGGPLGENSQFGNPPGDEDTGD